MKKIASTSLIFLFCISALFAQAPLPKGGKQLNAGFGFSNFGVPIYLGVDFGIHPEVSVGPQVSYRNFSDNVVGSSFDLSLTTIGFNGNYHFNKILDIASDFDFYAGVTMGYYIWSSPSNYGGTRTSGLGLDAQIGGRYFFSDVFGVNLEFGGGTASGGKFGITYIF